MTTSTAKMSGLAAFILKCTLLTLQPRTVSLPAYRIKNLVSHGHYLKTRIPYCSNSSSTFQYRLLKSGDVHPNPGPSEHNNIYTQSVESNHVHLKDTTASRISYDRFQLLNLKQSTKPRLPHNVWKNLLSLGVCVAKPTHRGSVGGTPKKKHIPRPPCSDPITRVPPPRRIMVVLIYR